MASASHCAPPMAELSLAHRADQVLQKLASKAAAPPHGFLAVALDVAQGSKKSWAARQAQWRFKTEPIEPCDVCDPNRTNRIDFVTTDTNMCLATFLRISSKTFLKNDI